MLWENRIVRHGTEAPDQLLANPRNWRIHPLAQQEALLESIERVGFIQSVTVNVVTGCVLNGHARVALAIRKNQPSIPVEYVRLTHEEEALALATLDTIGLLAVKDERKLNDLLREASNLFPDDIDTTLGTLLLTIHDEDITHSLPSPKDYQPKPKARKVCPHCGGEL